MLIDALSDIYNFAEGLIVSIPLDNPLAVLYVILNTLANLVLAVFGGGSAGSFLPF